MPNMQEGAAATVDGVLRAAINKRADGVGSKAVAGRDQNLGSFRSAFENAEAFSVLGV
jgi:hypothetical protein